MRVKVRFNVEAGQSPIVLDMRFLPRIGEQIHLGFRRVIEVLEVYRVDNDNRYGGIIRARYIQDQRTGMAAPSPRPMPMAPIPIRSLGVSPPPAVAAAQAATIQGGGAVFADVPLEELAAAHAGKSTQETACPASPAMMPDPAL